MNTCKVLNKASFFSNYYNFIILLSLIIFIISEYSFVMQIYIVQINYLFLYFPMLFEIYYLALAFSCFLISFFIKFN